MQQAAVFDCHCTDLLLSEDIVDHSCVQLSEMNPRLYFDTSSAILLKRLSNCPCTYAVQNSD